jgi:hypothetical protein
VRDLSTTARKEPEFKQKIVTELGQLESVERRWLAGIVAGILVGAIDLAIVIRHLGSIISGQPASIASAAFTVLVLTTSLLLVINLAAFAEYFSLELRVSVGRGMVIKKKRPGHESPGEEEPEAT